MAMMEHSEAMRHRNALYAAGCGLVFEDLASGMRRDRPELAKALTASRLGDTLVVWKLDRLGRSLPHLVELAERPTRSRVHLRSLTEAQDTARKWESALLVNVDNDTLKKILENEKAMQAAMNIEGFQALGDNVIETIINKEREGKRCEEAGHRLRSACSPPLIACDPHTRVRARERT